jgi:hypothetical protein
MRPKARWFWVLLLAAVAVASNGTDAFAAGRGNLKLAPLNPHYVKYLNGEWKGAAPSPLDWSYLRRKPAADASGTRALGVSADAKALPRKLDLST